MEASLDRIPRRHDEVVSRRTDDEVLLLDLARGGYFTLDGVGSRVWELCDGVLSVREIAARIAEEYDAPLATIEADVVELLGELESEQLVRHA